MKYNENFLKLKNDYLFARISRLAEEVASSGKEVIDLGIGDLKLPLFKGIGEAMAKCALDLGKEGLFKGYPPAEGSEELRAKISRNYKTENADISPDEIFVSDGAKGELGGIAELFGGSAKILMPEPYYPAAAEALYLAGNEITFLPCRKEEGFIPYPPFGKVFDAVYLCSPNNPTGSAMDGRDISLWINYALSTGAVIVFDGAYSAYAGQGIPKTIYAVKGAKDCAIEIRSFSKSYGFTGIRCGFTVVPKTLGKYNELWKRRLKCRTNGVSRISQAGAIACFDPETVAEREKRIKYYKTNAEIVKFALKKKNLWYNISCSSPYVFAECPAGQNSEDFVKKLYPSGRSAFIIYSVKSLPPKCWRKLA